MKFMLSHYIVSACVGCGKQILFLAFDNYEYKSRVCISVIFVLKECKLMYAVCRLDKEIF